MRYVDLHIHTTASDGTESPTQVVIKARSLGLVGIAITDHDTIQGADEGVRVGVNMGIEVVPGVEISCKWQNQRIHLLGFYIDPTDLGLISLLEWMRAGRDERLLKMLAKLSGLGIEIEQQEVQAIAKGETTGRPHIAQALIQHGCVSSFEEAFDKYLAYGRPAYADRPRPTIAEGIQTILDAQGIPVIAHPLTVDIPPSQLIKELIKHNLQGIEYYYPYAQVTGKPQAWYTSIDLELANLKKLATTHDLILTGGSDYHGSVPSKADMGSIPVPSSVLANLRLRYKKLYGTLPTPAKPA